jgi:hypothetical protein
MKNKMLLSTLHLHAATNRTRSEQCEFITAIAIRIMYRYKGAGFDFLSFLYFLSVRAP